LQNTLSGVLYLKLTLTLIQETKEELPKANFISDLMANLQNNIQKVALDVITGFGASSTMEYETYPEPNQGLPKMCKGLPFYAALSSQKFGWVAQRGVEYLFSQIDFLSRLPSSPDKYEAIVSRYVNPPLQVWTRWKDDKELCFQLINGVSPMDIELVTNLSRVPTDMQSLSADNKSVQQLISEKRLFIVDNSVLEKYPQREGLYFYAPILLVYKDNSEELNILGLRLTNKEAGKNKIYTAKSTPPNRYLFAKILFQSANNQVHQFKWHLGLTHLAMEPLAVSTFNTVFNKKHPIGLLLQPHFKDTIGINYLARRTLVAEVGAFTDKTFSLGTKNALNYFEDVWKAYKLKDYSFPEQLKSRGFDEKQSDGLQNFYYRDDGFLIWNAIKEYVKSVVDLTYKDNDTVKNDSVLQEWVDESRDPNKANFPGFPKIGDTDTLVETLTTIIFNCSAQHSAVNYSQYDYITYVPSRPDSIFQPMPEGDEDITWEYIEKALPNMIVAQFQALFAFLLTLPQFDPLLLLPDTENVFPEQHAAMKKRLTEIQQNISARNTKLKSAGKTPYPFLEPKNIATSIAI